MIKAVIFDNFGVFDQDPVQLSDLIKRLRPHYRIGMLSNADRPLLDKLLATNDATGLFDAVLASSESRYAKPQREIFEEIARRLDVDFGEMLFIDDWLQHTAAATSYGIRSILYTDPAQLEHALTKASIRTQP